MQFSSLSRLIAAIPALVLAAVISTPVQAQAEAATTTTTQFQMETVHIDDLMIHDPCIVAHKPTQTYYIYGGYSARDQRLRAQGATNAGVMAFTSKDLVTWQGPHLVFEIPGDSWADGNAGPWAPEVHEYKGKFYLFATLHAYDREAPDAPGARPVKMRGTQIFVADGPLGPFKPMANRPTPPEDHYTLDGTLYVSPEGTPYMVYCHEWIQIEIGTVEAVQLTPDLSAAVGEPFLLFKGDTADWVKTEHNHRGADITAVVTDGPWFHRTKNGKLITLWSSWTKDRAYGQAIVVSESGTLRGPWRHDPPEPILQDDRGHGMIFEDFEGRLILCLHRYFNMPATRVQLWELEDTGDNLRVVRKLLGAE